MQKKRLYRMQKRVVPHAKKKDCAACTTFPRDLGPALHRHRDLAEFSTVEQKHTAATLVFSKSLEEVCKRPPEHFKGRPRCIINSGRIASRRDSIKQVPLLVARGLWRPILGGGLVFPIGVTYHHREPFTMFISGSHFIFQIISDISLHFFHRDL